MCTASTATDSGTSATAFVPDVGKAGPAADPKLIEDLVFANRILCLYGVVDAYGHVSARHDKRPDRFLLARNMAPGSVTAADIVTFDLDGNPVDAAGRSVYLERFIHAEMYRARPDVNAVVHSHSPGVIPFGIVQGVPLRPVWHVSGFIGEAAPVFEIRDVAGDASNLLISDGRLGAALARSIGDGCVVLMRGHGATVVGPNLPLAVFRAIYTEINARLQKEALGLGTVTYLTPGEARATADMMAGNYGRAWDFWKKQVEAQVPR
jgi:HCOMODA/2-hydroxy-3-carboxy-muconic semialdehyde decarboxylase